MGRTHQTLKYPYPDSQLLGITYRRPDEVFFQVRLLDGRDVTLCVTGFIDSPDIRKAIAGFAVPDELYGVSQGEKAVTVHCSRLGNIVFPAGEIIEL